MRKLSIVLAAIVTTFAGIAGCGRDTKTEDPASPRADAKPKDKELVKVPIIVVPVEKTAPPKKVVGAKEMEPEPKDKKGAEKKEEPIAKEKKAEAGPRGAFKLVTPADILSIRQGEKRIVAVSVKGDEDFNQKVTVAFKTKVGVQVEPTETVIPADQTQVQVTIQIAKDALPGGVAVEVRATPEAGEAQTGFVRLKIDE